ncbi:MULTISPECIES: MFS transporter [Paenibacillus]|uniref:Major facilitator superfamily MFS_1 n=2 Tax=Paenibacillus lactis TaxID=228574 RepID=G4HEC4_9BACL|nr:MULTISPECIES: tetracycline resistance MFS efflux pump [Paenibacillus]EHB65193.1 major facilitator superfamily MFS_1 [Paenibacillus lactis 154]MBP1896061.1 DHA1 family multidrug resistance protein-like MFS transporter [Paenibacillus lactis]MCM3495517.1 tetracycline resistance MFS efflux pump [Paenibacillus lactis]GIO90458.1 tetracycline resistance MFS efflux pump [Paenibacillus lactis]HAG00735.1 tetracycline resistance MFS efflux pump [Paenibacillus lactis]
MSLLLRHNGAILLLMFNIFLVFTGIGLVIPIMPTYMSELHISGGTVGMLVAAFSLTQLLFSPLAGRLSDNMGRKRIIIAGMLVFALSEWLFGVANSPVLLFASRMLGGIGAALIMPAVMAYTADVTSKEERAKGMGFINAAITTGFIIGPGIGGFIAEFGIRVPFYAAAVAGAVAALITLLMLPESAAQKQVQASPGQKQPSLAVQLARSYREPYFLSLIIVFVLSFGLANYETVFGLFVDHKFGFTPTDIAMIITFGSISGAVVQATIFGWILNRFGEKRVITISLITAGICILLTLFVHKYWLIFLVTFLVFLSIDILRPAIGTQMSKLAGDQQGYVAGLNSAYTSLGNIAGPLVAGYLFDLDINYPYISASIVLILCFILAMRAGRAWTATETAVQERG